MSGNSFSRREFIAAGLSGSAAASLPPAFAEQTQRGQPAVALTNPGPGAWARWLDGRAPATNTGATWGVPWPHGKHKHTVAHFSLREPGGAAIPLQSWPLAFWPDGSLKWTAHALPVDAKLGAGPWEIVATREPVMPEARINVKDDGSTVEIDTGAITCKLNRAGRSVIDSVARNGHTSLRDGRLVLLSQDRAGAEGVTRHDAFESRVDRVVIEQRGPVRAVIKIEGSHEGLAHGSSGLAHRVSRVRGSVILPVSAEAATVSGDARK